MIRLFIFAYIISEEHVKVRTSLRASHSHSQSEVSKLLVLSVVKFAMSQLTLFGGKAKGEKFFKTAATTDYARVIERLWKKETGDRFRVGFHQWAQEQWATVFSVDEERRKIARTRQRKRLGL